jgi:outer membrane lipopolysaccharide assembly protein LptE/RlpB
MTDRQHFILWPALMALAVVALTSCGYHTAGRGTRLPASLQTIAVPGFVNKTQQYKIEQTLTKAVVREFTIRTKYRIVNQVEPDADATLNGTVNSVQVSPVTFDTNTGRVSSVLVIVAMNVSLVDRKGKVLFDNPAYTFREQYQISQDLPTFFEESSPAMTRLSSNFAQTLVSDILEAF